MKPLHIAAALVAVLATSACAPGMGVAVYGQPVYYGEIDMEYGVPPVIFASPIVIDGGDDDGPPIYLHVPPGYERHWARHCGEYNACGRPVYFVRERWYNTVYARRRGYGEREEYRGDEDRRERRGDEDRGGDGGGYAGPPGMHDMTQGRGYNTGGQGGGGGGGGGLRGMTQGRGYNGGSGDSQGGGGGDYRQRGGDNQGGGDGGGDYRRRGGDEGGGGDRGRGRGRGRGGDDD